MKGCSNLQSRLSIRLLTATAALAGALVIAPPSGLVPEAAAQSKADIEKAKKHFFEGKELYGQEKYLEAAEAFHAAYELSNRSELLYNVGKSYWKANELKKAETFFQQYLNALPDAPNADEVVESIIQIQEEMAAQMTSIEVTASRDGVAIFVDDEAEPRCQAPCTVSVLPGSHTLSVRPDGLDPITEELQIEANQPTSVNFELPGRLDLMTDQRAGSLKIAGVGSWSLPLAEPIALPPGEHDVVVTGAEGSRWDGTIDVPSGETTSLMVPLGAQSGGASTMRSFSYGLLGASAGFLVGGIVLGVQASSTHDALAEQQQALGSVDPDLAEQGRSEQAGANILYGLSAVSFASGAGLFAWDYLGTGASAEEEDIPASDEEEDSETAAGDAGDELLGVTSSAASDSDSAESGEEERDKESEKERERESEKEQDEPVELF